MGTYKVPQNVEAEDKILGPLSIKQFIYAVIGLAYGGLTFVLFKAFIVIWVIIGIPPTLAMLALGLYQREDQPLETFLLAVAQFILRPKQRLWEKEPIAEVFRVEPPKPKPGRTQRDPREVRGQLQQLAELVDTRGWSAKQPELQDPEESPVIDLDDRIGGDQQPAPVLSVTEAIGQAPAPSPHADITPADDMMDAQNPNVQNLNVLLENTVKSIREEALAKMGSQPTGAYQPAAVASTMPPAMAPTPMPAASAATGIPLTPGLPTPVPATYAAAVASAVAQAAPQTVYANPDPSISPTGMATPPGDILRLATEGMDLTVGTIATEAHRQDQLAEGQAVDLRNGSNPNPTTGTI